MTDDIMQPAGDGGRHGGRPLCGARKRQSEGTCKHPAGWGTSHPGDGPCKLHGGATTHVARASRARLLEASVRGELARIDIHPVDDPVLAIRAVVGEELAMLDLCRAKLVEVTESWTRIDNLGAEDVRAAVTVYERALDRAERGLAKLVSLGIEARVADARALTAQAYVTALTAIITRARDTDLPPEQLILDALGGPQ